VLPFENLTGNPNQEYFVDGMTDELITSLARVSVLRVASRTSSMHYKGVQKTLLQIAHELSVDTIVEGTVSRSQDRVRVTVQLIDARNDRHLWAQDYDRQVGDLVLLQNQIAREVAKAIGAQLTPGERGQPSQEHRVAPAAYEAYLKGRYYWNRWNEDGLKKGVEYFNRALEQDPGYAEAWAGLSDAYDLLGDFGISRPQEVLPKAKEAAQRALALDEGLSEAHVSLGGELLHLEWSWLAAEKELQRAIALDPNNAMAHQWYGYYLISMGRFEGAIQEMKQARDLDPLSPNKSGSLGWALYLAGRYDQAVQP
jgi:TolB-like protein